MAKPLSFSKKKLFHGSITISWQNLSTYGEISTSWQNLLTSWLNFSFFAKPLYFIVKPLPFGKTFVLHGLPSTFWQNIFPSWLNMSLWT
jgi:hypothetical protein